MDLVGQGVGEEDDIHAVFLVGKALHAAVHVRLEARGALGSVRGDEALGGRLGFVALDEDRRGGGDLGEVAEAVGIENAVAVENVARVHKGLIGIDNRGQAVHRAVQLGVFHTGDEVRGGGCCGIAVTDIRQAVFHGGLCGGVELRRTCGGVRLGHVGGRGEAHEVHRGGIIVPAGALADLRRVDKACAALSGRAGDVDGRGLGDDLCLHARLVDARGREQVLARDGLIVGVGADEIAHVVAARDHADGLAGLEKFVDGGGGVFGGIGEDDIFVLVTCEVGGQHLGVSERVVVVHRVAADGSNGLVGGGLGHGDHVEAARFIEGGDALGVEDGPAVDQRAVIQRAVGDRTLGLIHRDDHRTGGVGNAVIGEFLFSHVDLDVVSREPLHHVGRGLKVGLVLAVERDDIALGIEVAVLARAVVLRTEDVHLRALDVVLVAQPLADHAVSVGVQVVHAALIDGDLGFKIGELFGGNIGGVAEDTVLRRLSGIVVVGGQLNGIGNGALEHGELGSVARGHIVPRVFPVSLGAAAGVAQVIALRDHIAVVAIVVGDRRDAQRLAAGDEVVGEQVILEVRLVRGIAGLALEGLHTAVELGKRHGVERADELLHVGRLARGLEGVVAVEVIAVGGVSRKIGTSVDIFLGNKDKEHVGQQLVLDVYSVALHGVILFKVDLAGLAVVIDRQVT